MKKQYRQRGQKLYPLTVRLTFEDHLRIRKITKLYLEKTKAWLSHSLLISLALEVLEQELKTRHKEAMGV